MKPDILTASGAVKVDRSTRWGNPFHHHGDGAPMDAALAVLANQEP